MSTELEDQQLERFALEVANGETALVAYRAVAGNGKPNDREMGSRWLSREDVQRRIAELLQANAAQVAMTVMERRQIAAEIARDKSVEPAVRLSATIIDAKHAGEFMTHAEQLRAKENAPLTQLLNDLRGHPRLMEGDSA